MQPHVPLPHCPACQSTNVRQLGASTEQHPFETKIVSYLCECGTGFTVMLKLDKPPKPPGLSESA